MIRVSAKERWKEMGGGGGREGGARNSARNNSERDPDQNKECELKMWEHKL